MMAEYIEREREAAIEKTEAFCDVFVTKWTDEKVLAWIKNLPAADVAPVVRCRECVYRGDYGCPMYHEEYYWDEDDGGDYISIDNTHDDGFCDLGAKMDGERKGDDD